MPGIYLLPPYLDNEKNRLGVKALRGNYYFTSALSSEFANKSFFYAAYTYTEIPRVLGCSRKVPLRGTSDE